MRPLLAALRLTAGCPRGDADQPSWRRFERAASRYEAWYQTRQGERASRVEKRLLERLLASFPGARGVVDVGCGTGHFAGWLADRGLTVVCLDRSPAMLREARSHAPRCAAVLADARDLPLADRSVDLVLLVTVLEFVDRPAEVVAEAVRVARRGVLVIAFNRWSTGALSRRWGPASAGSLTSRAVDFSLPELRKLLATAAGARLRALEWESALFPCLSRPGPMRVPAGDVLAFALALEPPR